MTGKKDDGCCHDANGATRDELAPMRKWESGGPATGYATGPTHLDRTDYREGNEPAEDEVAKDETAPAEGDEPEGDAQS